MLLIFEYIFWVLCICICMLIKLVFVYCVYGYINFCGILLLNFIFDLLFVRIFFDYFIYIIGLIRVFGVLI